MLAEHLANEVRELMKEPMPEKNWHSFVAQTNGSSWTECWIWQGCKLRGRMPYGRFTCNKKPTYAHRAIAAAVYGIIPKHLEVRACLKIHRERWKDWMKVYARNWYQNRKQLVVG